MKEARFKGAVYQRREKQSPSKHYKPKVTTPPLLDPPIVHESNIEMGEWISSAKIHIYPTDVLKISSQKEKLLKSIEDSQSETHNIVKENPLPNCLCQKLFPDYKETSQHNLKYSIRQN